MTTLFCLALVTGSFFKLEGDDRVLKARIDKHAHFVKSFLDCFDDQSITKLILMPSLIKPQLDELIEFVNAAYVENMPDVFKQLEKRIEENSFYEFIDDACVIFPDFAKAFLKEIEFVLTFDPGNSFIAKLFQTRRSLFEANKDLIEKLSNPSSIEKSSPPVDPREPELIQMLQNIQARVNILQEIKSNHFRILGFDKPLSLGTRNFLAVTMTQTTYKKTLFLQQHTLPNLEALEKEIAKLAANAITKEIGLVRITYTSQVHSLVSIQHKLVELSEVSEYFENQLIDNTISSDSLISNEMLFYGFPFKIENKLRLFRQIVSIISITKSPDLILDLETNIDIAVFASKVDTYLRKLKLIKDNLKKP
jgi:hypothetical protein